VWRYAPRLALWKGIIGDSAWVVTATFFQGFLLYGDYLVLGLLLPTAVVGQYFFGYQFTQQISALMAINLIYVLMPVLSRLASDPPRQAQALLRTCRVSVMVLSMLSLGFAVVIDPLETLIWNNKWDAAVPLMQVFSLAAPLRIFTANIQTMLNARGQFKTVAWLSLLEGIVYMAAAGLAALAVGANLAPLAALIATAHVAFNLGLSVVYMRRWGIEAGAFLKAILPAWLAALLCAAATAAASRFALDGNSPLGSFFFNGLLFSVLYIGMMRAAYASHVADLMAIIPVRVARVLRRLIWLREAPATANNVADE
jgi:PST family polysaccharide transporter